MATKGFGPWRVRLNSLPDRNDLALEGYTIKTDFTSNVAVVTELAYGRQGLSAAARVPEVAS